MASAQGLRQARDRLAQWAPHQLDDLRAGSHPHVAIVPAHADPGALGLVGRHDECEALDRLVADALAGTSRATVLRGDAGAGKTALLSYLSERAAGWRVTKTVGVESEMELAYSSLHQLCAPLLDHL